MPDPEELALLRLARRAENDHLRLHAAWPGRLRLAATPARAENAMLPYRFATAFPGVDAARLRSFALACRLLGDVPRLDPEAALAAQLECHALLARTFPGDERIWDALRARAARATWARGEVTAYRAGRRDLTALADDDALAYARAAAELAQVTAAGVACLADDAAPLDALRAAIDAYAEGRALLDAVRNWRDDVAANVPTVVTARLACTTEDPARRAEALYLGGIAAGAAEEARDALGRAAATCEALTIRWPAVSRTAAEAKQMLAVFAQLRAVASALL